MKNKLNQITAASLCLLFAGFANAPAAAANDEQLNNVRAADTDIPAQDTESAAGDRSENKTDITGETQIRPVKRGYGIGYEYRMRHRNEMSRLMQPQRPVRPERPEHPLRMERPERPDVPVRPARPERPGHHGR